jgi:hypothetical protein
MLPNNNKKASDTHISLCAHIYIYKEESLFVFCLSVLYAFGWYKSQSNQTLHGTPLGLKESREGVNAMNGAWGGVV